MERVLFRPRCSESEILLTEISLEDRSSERRRRGVYRSLNSQREEGRGEMWVEGKKESQRNLSSKRGLFQTPLPRLNLPGSGSPSPSPPPSILPPSSSFYQNGRSSRRTLILFLPLLLPFLDLYSSFFGRILRFELASPSLIISLYSLIFGKLVKPEYICLGVYAGYFAAYKAYQYSKPPVIETPNDPIKNIAASLEEENFIREFMKELETAK
ncbi:hypothetical protein BDY24DRAFT_185954 [Mrakia frigida]|uniref:uncharacterized protein n=1 Tax=Mrakia frigida TaxID=29902 RepID=UPI003FCC1200